MAIYSMGEVIKRCRIAKNITQEELAFGICTPSGLSKMENGKREPSPAKFIALMERMGEWSDSYNFFVGEEYYRLEELKYQIRGQIHLHHYEEAQKLLDEFEKRISKTPDETTYFQFLRMERTICESKGIIKDNLEKLTEIMMMTVPDYGKRPLSELFLSHQETMLINNIAIAYAESGERSTAIKLWDELKEFLEKGAMNRHEKETLLGPVILNLVKYLGLEKRYEEALEHAESGINTLVATGKTLYVSELHYDIAWILVQMDRDKYAEEVAEELLLSICTDLGNRQFENARFSLDFARKVIPDIMQRTNLCRCEELYHNIITENHLKNKK